MSKRVPRFPSRAPIGVLLALLASAFLLFGTFKMWRHSQNEAERFYLGGYIKSQAWQMVPRFTSGPETPRAFWVSTGDRTWQMEVQPRAFQAFVSQSVYKGQSPFVDVPYWLIGWFLVTLVLIVTGAVADTKRKQRAREGVRLRGARLMTIKMFNRTQKSKWFWQRKKTFSLEAEDADLCA